MVLRDNYAKIAFEAGYPANECEYCYLEIGKTKGIRNCVSLGVPVEGAVLVPNQYKVYAWLTTKIQLEIVIKYVLDTEISYYAELTYKNKTVKIMRKENYYYDTYVSAFRAALQEALLKYEIG